MNLGSLVEMLKADPTIADDIPNFLTRMNEQTIEQVVKVRTVVVEETRMVSLAETLHGGAATEHDVQEALKMLAAEPLHAEAEAKYREATAAIHSGEVTTSDELAEKLGEKQPKDGV